jgi:hypothetical protein
MQWLVGVCLFDRETWFLLVEKSDGAGSETNEMQPGTT